MKYKKNMRKGVLSVLLLTLAFTTTGGLAACKKDKKKEPVIEPGLGVFYYDAGAGDEYQLALNDDHKATFIAKGESKSATYSVEGDVLKLTFEDGSVLEAKLFEDTLTLTCEDGDYKLYKKIYYTVSYEEVGGSDVADVTVVNGQTFAKPADPKRDGYEFLGWYLDSEYKTPYSFAQIVTGNVTLYAQWALVNPAMVQYTVDFDLGYEADKLSDAKTIGGKLYNVPTPTRNGYKFCGWWVSMYEDGEKLTYKYNENTVFTANTTLFAQWEAENLGAKLSSPEVEVDENGVKWNGVQGVSVYKLKVTGPRGFNTVDEDVSGTNYTIDFASAPAGDYDITVTAVAQSGAANNSETVKRYYKNKAVGRVSQFTVLDGSRLTFNRVDNAENYYITIDCGNDAHGHVSYNIGDSTYYDFSACEMQEGGIKFVVTATAEGYAPVTSEEFVYVRALDKVSGISVDEETQVLSWYAVENATNYIVTVTCGDNTHTHQVVDNGSKTTFSLRECPATADGKIKISVYPKTDGYNSPEATEYVYSKTKLAAPANLTLVNVDGAYKFTWKAVSGATEYTVKIGNVVLTATKNEIDITNEIAWVEGTSYNVEVKAKNATQESVWSEKTVFTYGAMNPSLKYKDGVVYWKPTVGAIGYQLQVESTGIVNVDGDAASAPVTLVQEGTNEIFVRCVYESGTSSNWVSVAVENVQKIVLYDANKVLDTVYKAPGDKLNFVKPEKAGYDFAGWYNTQKGPESNGEKYDKEYFTGTSELVLYAYWTPATYKVTYEVGTNGELATKESNVTYSKGYKLDVPTVADTSKVFLGWFLGPDSSAQQLTNDRGESLKDWSIKGDTTIYAQYITDVLSFNLLEDGTYSVSKGRNIHRVTTLTIPEKYNNIAITVIEGYAFEQRAHLVSITMPDTIKIVERETAFRLCTNLQEINVYHVDGNNTPVFYSHEGVLLKNDEITGQNQLFYYPLGKSGSYAVPEGVTEIPLNLFRGSAVTSVTIPTSVTVIRENAFRECAKLENVEFLAGGSDNLTIEDGAFNSCTSLVEITLPSRLSELKINEETRTLSMFGGCDALEYVNVEKGSSAYGSVEGVLTNSGKTKLLYCPAARSGSYTIPRGIVEVGERAFYNCTRLNEIVIPGYVEEVEDYAFYGCNKVARVVFESGAIAGMELNVGSYAFAEMTNLKSVVFKDGSTVATLGDYAFANAKGLREFIVPATMTYIGDYAFDNASALATISFAKDGKDLTFGNYVFNECKALTLVELPASVVKLNLGVFDGCVNISDVKVDADNEYYKDIDGIVFSEDGTELVFFPKGRQPDANGEYVMPNGVVTISEGAFKGMRYIEKIVIKNTVTSIGKGAFANSLQLKTLTFEEGNDAAKLTIDESAFEGCAAIETVALPTRTEVIGAKAFYNVSMKSVTFPAGLTTIGDYAFAKSSLTTVEIPAGLSVFGTNVFEECVALKTVTFATGFNAKEIPVGTFKGSAITAIEIPASIEKIGYTAFNDCTDLASLTFANATADLVIGYMPEGMDAGNDSDKKEEDKKGESSSSLTGVFMNCRKLTSLEIPDRTVYIGDRAFANCTTLATVTINATSKLQRFGSNAFNSCVALTSIYVPKTVENTPYVNEQTPQEYAIGSGAFASSGLTSITFAMDGTGDLSIGDGAFLDTKITSFNFPKRLAPIYTTISRVEGLDKGSLPKIITDINVQDGGEYYGSLSGIFYKKVNGALAEMSIVPYQKTGTITVPASVTYLPAYCMSGLAIDNIEWEDADNANGLPLVIGSSALNGMPNLKTVRFPARTVEIGNNMFSNGNNTSISNQGNSRVEEVYIPANVEKIGARMFYYCMTIKTVEFADGCKIKEIPDDMFCVWSASAASKTNTNELTEFRIPANVEKIGVRAFRGCTKLPKIDWEEGSKLTRLSGSMFEGTALTEFIVPDGVEVLDGSVFNAMAYLTKITMNAKFDQISTESFLFSGCSALEEVVIPAAHPTYASKDGVVYMKDLKTLVYYPAAKPVGALKEGATPDEETGKYAASDYDGVYVTPAGVQNIGAFAFRYAKYLRDLTISADVLSIGAEAFCGSPVKKLTFAERTNTLSLADKAFYNAALGNYTDTLYIPNTVEFVGSAIFLSTDYKKVEFAEGNQTATLDNTFNSCLYLQEVTGLPDGLTSMDSTFQGCTALTTVTFVENAYVNTLKRTFYGCKKLASIEIGGVGSMLDSAGQGVFEGCTALTSATFKKIGYIGKDTFRGCTKLASFVIPDDCSGMGESAFYGCTALTSVTFSTGLESISNYAFKGCSNLTAVDIRGRVVSIGEEAFQGCAALTSVTLPDGLVSIGNKAFYGANRVSAVVLPESLETIGDYAFYGWTSLKKVDVPVKVKTIGNYAFSNCSSVEEFNIPEGALLESIGDYALEGMVKMKEFFIPKTLTKIGIGVFTGWSQLDNIEVEGGNLEFAYDGGILYNATYTTMLLVTPNVPETLEIRSTITSLARGVFAGLGFKHVILPDTLTEIPDRAFENCTNLISVKMPKYLERIGESAFENCISLTSIEIPNTVKSTFEKAANEERDKATGGTIPMSYYEVEDVDGIGNFAFANCIALETVNFVAGGSQRLSIGEYAFYGCSKISSLVLPNRLRGEGIPYTAWSSGQGQGGESHGYNMQGVGEYAFARCTNLVSVVFEETGVATFSEKLMIGIGAFTDCTKLESVQFNSALGDMFVAVSDGRNMTDNGIAAIQGRAFAGCTALTTVTFAEGFDFSKATVVTTAFEDCTNATIDSNVVYMDGSFFVGGAKPYANNTIDLNYWIDGQCTCSWCTKYHASSCEHYSAAWKHGISK